MFGKKQSLEDQLKECVDKGYTIGVVRNNAFSPIKNIKINKFKKTVTLMEAEYPSVDTLKELRYKSGASIHDCAYALMCNDNNVERAYKFILELSRM